MKTKPATRLALLSEHPYALELLYFDRRIIRKSRKLSFDLDKLSTNDCLQSFRFDKEDLTRIKRLLKIPDTVRCGRHARTCTGIEALCILLRRLVYPNRLFDLEKEFGRTSEDLSHISNWMLRHVFNNFRSRWESFDLPWYDLEHLTRYSEAILNRGTTLNKCWGFLDGTVRPICRPKYQFQRTVYNGHKRTHALKYQTLVVPSGLIANIFGGVEGRRHDTFLLHESKLLSKLQSLRNERNEHFYLYADQGYPLSSTFIVPFRGGQALPPDQSQTGKYFGMNPPSLDDYLDIDDE